MSLLSHRYSCSSVTVCFTVIMKSDMTLHAARQSPQAASENPLVPVSAGGGGEEWACIEQNGAGRERNREEHSVEKGES